jgi:hypothetical protein
MPPFLVNLAFYAVSDAAISECALQLGIQNFTCSCLMLYSAEAGARYIGGSLQQFYCHYRQRTGSIKPSLQHI